MVKLAIIMVAHLQKAIDQFGLDMDLKLFEHWQLRLFFRTEIRM